MYIYKSTYRPQRLAKPSGAQVVWFDVRFDASESVRFFMVEFGGPWLSMVNQNPVDSPVEAGTLLT